MSVIQHFDMFKIDGVHQISVDDARPYLMNVHYAKRMPSISYAYGLFERSRLTGVVTFGSPASDPLCRGVCGVEHKEKVIELNRLVLLHNKKNQASLLVAQAIKKLPKPKIIVSYADTAENHVGYVYQATNFLFTGTTKDRTDMAATDGKHPRHHAGVRSLRVYRSSKHRYVYLHASKTERKRLRKALRYPVYKTYPKGKGNDNFKRRHLLRTK